MRYLYNDETGLIQAAVKIALAFYNYTYRSLHKAAASIYYIACVLGTRGFKPFLPHQILVGGRRGWADAHALLQCPLLPGNSRVDVCINYRFNGSMTKNVKEGLGAGNAGPASGLLASLKMRVENQSVSNETDL